MVDPSGTDNIRVSVIIPTYNRVDFLPSALDSVLSQSYSINEIIVVDDGSTDKTVEKLSHKYHSVTFLKQRNQGVSAARNTGIREAKSPWIAFLDSDDQWKPDKIEKQIKYLSQNLHLKACHTGEQWIRNGSEVPTAPFLNKASRGLFERSLERCLICPSSILLHHSIFRQIGFFDVNLTICEDYDFWLRLLLSYQVELVDEPLVIKTGGHSDQLSTSTWGIDRFRIQSLEKIFKTETLISHQKKLILETIARKAELLAKGFIKHGKELEAGNYLIKKDKALENLALINIASN